MDGTWTTPIDDRKLDFPTSAMAVDQSGALWFNHEQGVRVHRADGSWEDITTADGLRGGAVEVIAAAPDGSVWFSSEEGGVSILWP
jgi:streptogramin lyase